MQNNTANINAVVRGGIIHIPSASITTNTTTVLATINPLSELSSAPIAQGNFRVDLRATSITGATVLTPLVEVSKDGGTTWTALASSRFILFGVVNGMEQDVTATSSNFRLTATKTQQGFGVTLNSIDDQLRYRISVVSSAIAGTTTVQGVAVFNVTNKNELML